MPAPRMRDINISRAKPAIRLTMVSPPIVPVALRRFIGAPPPASCLTSAVGRRFRRSFDGRGPFLAAAALLGGLDLGHVGGREIDRIEQQRREAGAGHRL